MGATWVCATSSIPQPKSGWRSHWYCRLLLASTSDRLRLSNTVFNDDIKIARVVDTPEGLSIETSQPAIEGRPATADEIRKEMEELGFRQVHHDGVFYRDRDAVLAWDLQGNSLITSDGAFAPIDAMLRTAPAELSAKIAAQP